MYKYDPIYTKLLSVIVRHPTQYRDSLPVKGQDGQRFIPWWIYPNVVQKYVWKGQGTANVKDEDQEEEDLKTQCRSVSSPLSSITK